MNFLKSSFFLFALLLVQTVQASPSLQNNVCAALSPTELSAKAVSYLKAKSLLPTDSTSWKLFAITENAGHCYGVLNSVPGESLGDVIEVVAIDPLSKKIQLVEEVHAIPQKIRAGIGKAFSKMSDPHFYWEFTEESALEAFKSIVARVPYQGLEGCVDAKNILIRDYAVVGGSPTGKLDWDPTPGRTWQLSRATFNLRRGLSVETDDIGPRFWDEFFFDSLKGSIGCAATGLPVGHIAPWGGSELNLIYDEQLGWKEVNFDPRFRP